MLRLKSLITAILLFAGRIYSFAQKDTCEFILADTTAHAGKATYYLASNINNWDPSDSLFRFKKDKDGTNYLIGVFDKATKLEFKFTKGNWDNAECDKTGGDINNHLIRTDTAKFNVFYVQGWKDDFPSKQKEHTASANVHIIDTAFYIPQLKRTRRIWIYLPAGYKTNGNAYPVLYMHDGQNLFDEYTSGYGEWGIDECLDTLIKKGAKPSIVVGIDCGEKRLNEYNPYSNDRFGKGEGDAYINFIIETLKPFIDKHYRTLPQKQNTIIAGSSMGGLISYYAILKHPDVFGKAGVFSPSFWIAPEIKPFTDSASAKLTKDQKIFFYIGKQEGDSSEQDMLEMENRLTKNSSVKYYNAIDPEGKHNEKAWRKWFPVFYEWIMKDDK